MDNNLGSKKINNKQLPTEELDKETKKNKLEPEVEIDANGNKKIVQRARNNDGSSEHRNDVIPGDEFSTEQQTQKMIENKDHNSDITPNRYPNSHPDNHEDRGNIKLDE